MHDRCEDAVLAAKSALKDGAVLGGGRIWLDMLAFLGSLSVDDSLDLDMKIALEILSSAIIAPFMQLFSNAGFAQDEILEIMSELAKDPELLYDLNKLKIVPISQANVYDSATAVKEAIANAASIASIFGTMSGVVVYPRESEIDKEEAKKEAHLKSIVDNPEAYANINDHRV
jgi:chaperonin GroEL (HSP60 family)